MVSSESHTVKGNPGPSFSPKGFNLGSNSRSVDVAYPTKDILNLSPKKVCFPESLGSSQCPLPSARAKYFWTLIKRLVNWIEYLRAEDATVVNALSSLLCNKKKSYFCMSCMSLYSCEILMSILGEKYYKSVEIAVNVTHTRWYIFVIILVSAGEKYGSGQCSFFAGLIKVLLPGSNCSLL